jgi:hypothetical protein
MRSSGKQTIAFPYFVPDKQQKQIASGSHRIAAAEGKRLTWYRPSVMAASNQKRREKTNPMK